MSAIPWMFTKDSYATTMGLSHPQEIKAHGYWFILKIMNQERWQTEESGR